MRVCPQRHYHITASVVRTESGEHWTHWCQDCGAIRHYKLTTNRRIEDLTEWVYPAITELVRGRKTHVQYRHGVYRALGSQRGGGPNDHRTDSRSSDGDRAAGVATAT